MFSRQTSSHSTPIDPQIQFRVEKERVQLLYKQNVSGIITLAVFGTVYLFVMQDTLSLSFLIPWATALYGSAIARFYFRQKFHRELDQIQTLSRLRKYLYIAECLLFVSGFLWAAIAVQMPFLPTLTGQVATSLIVVMMSAGAVVAYFSSIRAMLLVFLTAMVPWSISLFSTGETHYMLMGTMIVGYIGAGIMAATNLSRFVARSLRLSEENAQLAGDLQRALSSSGSATWHWDTISNEIKVRGDFSKMLGIEKSPSSISTRDFFAFVVQEDRKYIVEMVQHALRIGGEFEIEHRVQHPDGTIGYLAHRGRVISPTALTGISWDVTTRREREVLERERSEHEAANRAKSVLLANASHEIRTPLAAINGFADMLLHNPHLPKEARADVQMIQRNGKYLVSLVSDLLDLSHVESGQIYIQKQLVNTFDEINDIVSLMRPTIESKGLELRVKFDSLIPDRIETDVTRFREILINVLMNANKFTERGSIRLHISHRNKQLVINVADTGIGISPEEVKRLFHPFHRGKEERVQRVQGSGLGLALARRLARLLGGDVELVRSAVGEGSEFQISIAAGENVNLVPIKSATQPNHQTLAATRKLEGRNILVVDDSADLLVLMKRFLEKQGAHVDVRVNGKEAVDLTRDKKFDVILMDIKMPVMDGYAATSEIRRTGYSDPIIAVTAHASTEDRQLCYQAGFDSYVSKPVDFPGLLEDLGRYMH